MKASKSQINIFLLSLFLTFVSSFVFSQEINEELDALINEANYDEAIQLADALLRHSPKDASLNFKIGYCYLNTVLRKDKSLFYLKKAVEVYKKTNSNSIEAIEAKFQLGKAYHVNYQFEKAIETFTSLKNQVKNQEVKSAIDKEVNQCKTGFELSKKPVETQITILSNIVGYFCNTIK